MRKPRIIFFDIDGTLIDMEKKQVTPLMLDTLHRLKDEYSRILQNVHGAKIAAWWDRAVGTCVAMANGSADLKAAATHLCGSCAEDGIYHFCAENGLI